MSEWLKEMRCKRIGYAYAGSNPAPPTGRTCKAGCQAQLAQLVEHLHGKEGVVGSSPTLGSLLLQAVPPRLLHSTTAPGGTKRVRPAPQRTQSPKGRSAGGAVTEGGPKADPER